MYDWGYHSSDSEYVHVSRVVDGERREDLFDVTLYDREVIDPNTGRNCEDQSLFDLRELLSLANIAIGLQAEINRLREHAVEKIAAWDEEHDDEDGIGDAGFEDWDARATYEGHVEVLNKLQAFVAASEPVADKQ